MNRRTTLAAIIGMLCGMIAGGIAVKAVKGAGADMVCDTVTVVETCIYKEPAAKDSVRTQYVTRYLPVVRHDTIMPDRYAQENGEAVPPLLLSDERDSAAVEIPIMQKCYESDAYRAYVSGYEARLDSIFVFAPTTTIRTRERKPPGKWHIGITGGFGYGFNQQRVEPFVGVGITYSIISF